MAKSSGLKWRWLEEYRVCSCSFLARIKKDLPGYCALHGTDRRRAPIRIPADDTEKLGYAHQG